MAEFTCRACKGTTTYDGEGYWYCSHCRESFYEGYDEDGEPAGGDRLSVHDAALLWASRGKDEDYTFGYTEEELENAL